MHAVCENNTVLPIASFITQNVVADETVKNISLFCVFHGDIMDVNFQICFNSTILDVPHNTCIPANDPRTNNYYFNRTNLNCTSVGEITIKNVPAGDYNYSCNAVGTNNSAHLSPGNTLDSNICKFDLKRCNDGWMEVPSDKVQQEAACTVKFTAILIQGGV